MNTQGQVRSEPECDVCNVVGKDGETERMDVQTEGKDGED